MHWDLSCKVCLLDVFIMGPFSADQSNFYSHECRQMVAGVQPEGLILMLHEPPLYKWYMFLEIHKYFFWKLGRIIMYLVIHIGKRWKMDW